MSVHLSFSVTSFSLGSRFYSDGNKHLHTLGEQHGRMVERVGGRGRRVLHRVPRMVMVAVWGWGGGWRY